MSRFVSVRGHTQKFMQFVLSLRCFHRVLNIINVHILVQTQSRSLMPVQ